MLNFLQEISELWVFGKDLKYINIILFAVTPFFRRAQSLGPKLMYKI